MKVFLIYENEVEKEIKGTTVKFELAKDKVITVELHPHENFADSLNLTSESGDSGLFSTFAVKPGAANVLHLYVDLHAPRTDIIDE